MIAALIGIFSIAALLQFFVSYCRSVIAAYSKVELSDQVREVTGIGAQPVNGDEFRRLVSLVRLCPERGDDGMEIRLVGAYHGMLKRRSWCAAINCAGDCSLGGAGARTLLVFCRSGAGPANRI